MRPALALLLCLPAALAAELAAIAMLISGPEQLPALELAALVGLHLFAAVVAAEGLRLRFPPDDPHAVGAWRGALTLALLLPAVGPVVVAVLTARPPRTRRSGLDDFLSPMEHRRQQAEAELAAEAGRGRADVNVEALGDALKDEDRAKRLGAVEALRGMQNKQAVELLSRSLKNTVFEVRFHAVEALAGINKKHSEKIARATAALEREDTPAARRAVGEVYFEYAALEMEEASIQQHLYRNAALHLRRSLAVSAPDPQIVLKIAIALEKLGETEAALNTYRAALAAQPESPEALLGIARIQYRAAQYDQLRETCRRLLALPQLDAQVVPALRLWAEGPTEARPS